MLKAKKSAMELSIGTIVVVVIAVTMLILGLVLVRTIMCSAIGLTGEINDKMKGEMNRLFQTTGGEVVCIGSEGEPITLVPGRLNIIYCAVNAPTEADYTISATNIAGSDATADITGWVQGKQIWRGAISPGDELPKKVLRLNIPKNAGEQDIQVAIQVRKGNTLISTQDLDFSVRRVGFLRSAMC